MDFETTKKLITFTYTFQPMTPDINIIEKIF